MVRQSIVILALLNEFVYDYRGNNTYVIQEKTALSPTNKQVVNIAVGWHFQPNLGLIQSRLRTYNLSNVFDYYSANAGESLQDLIDWFSSNSFGLAYLSEARRDTVYHLFCYKQTILATGPVYHHCTL